MEDIVLFHRGNDCSIWYDKDKRLYRLSDSGELLKLPEVNKIAYPSPKPVEVELSPELLEWLKENIVISDKMSEQKGGKDYMDNLSEQTWQNGSNKWGFKLQGKTGEVAVHKYLGIDYVFYLGRADDYDVAMIDRITGERMTGEMKTVNRITGRHFYLAKQHTYQSGKDGMKGDFAIGCKEGDVPGTVKLMGQMSKADWDFWAKLTDMENGKCWAVLHQQMHDIRWLYERFGRNNDKWTYRAEMVPRELPRRAAPKASAWEGINRQLEDL